jgi:hypothetical protein
VAVAGSSVSVTLAPGSRRAECELHF